MTEKEFLENYLWPSDARLDYTFTHTLPPIEGLEKSGDFIVQSEIEDTFSTNIITKYESKTSGIRLVEVYKNTQNKATSFFVRLVGTMSLVKNGYPFVILDASIRNVSKNAPEREDIATRAAIHFPQASPEQRKIFLPHLTEQAKRAGISYGGMTPESSPDFWGTVWLAQGKGIDLDMLRQLRDYAWSAYKDVIEQTEPKTPFDYRPMQTEMVFNAARREHLTFAGRGLSVPTEVQAAFFSLMVAGL